MSASKFDFERRIFFDRTGRLRILSKASLEDWDLMLDLLPLFGDELEKVNPDGVKGFGEIWSASNEIRELGTAIIRLCGIDPAWLDGDMLGALLYSYEDEEGFPHKGKILEWYFPDRVEVAGESVTWKEKYAMTIAGLWKSEDSLETALKLAGEIPVDKLDAIFAARAKLEDLKDESTLGPSQDELERLVESFGRESIGVGRSLQEAPVKKTPKRVDEGGRGKMPKVRLEDVVSPKWVEVDPSMVGL